jgi:hypothetical protein
MERSPREIELSLNDTNLNYYNFKMKKNKLMDKIKTLRQHGPPETME